MQNRNSNPITLSPDLIKLHRDNASEWRNTSYHSLESNGNYRKARECLNYAIREYCNIPETQREDCDYLSLLHVHWDLSAIHHHTKNFILEGMHLESVYFYHKKTQDSAKNKITLDGQTHVADVFFKNLFQSEYAEHAERYQAKSEEYLSREYDTSDDDSPPDHSLIASTYKIFAEFAAMQSLEELSAHSSSFTQNDENVTSSSLATSEQEPTTETDNYNTLNRSHARSPVILFAPSPQSPKPVPANSWYQVCNIL